MISNNLVDFPYISDFHVEVNQLINFIGNVRVSFVDVGLQQIDDAPNELLVSNYKRGVFLDEVSAMHS